MSTVMKAFQYIFNTSKEDQKVSMVLSGWESDDTPCKLDFALFDAGVRQKLSAFQAVLFSSCSGFADPALNLDSAVADIL